MFTILEISYPYENYWFSMVLFVNICHTYVFHCKCNDFSSSRRSWKLVCRIKVNVVQCSFLSTFVIHMFFIVNITILSSSRRSWKSRVKVSVAQIHVWTTFLIHMCSIVNIMCFHPQDDHVKQLPWETNYFWNVRFCYFIFWISKGIIVKE